MKKDFRQKNTQGGFTLIETLVAIFILLISTTGPLSFAQSGLRASFLARDQVVAFYLAQDATETIKNLRDNNSLKGDSWLTGLDACMDGDGFGCRMQTGSNFIIEKCTSNICDPMHYYNNTSKKEFVLDSSPPNTIPSKYTRTVYINELIKDQEAQIIVKVEWDTAFFSERKIVVQENIYNWIPAYTVTP